VSTHDIMLMMSRKRKSKKEKIASETRKQIITRKVSSPAKKSINNPHTKQIKKDLLKTLVLSVFAIGIVLVLYWGWI
jgi:hypothetical protein